MRIGELNRRVAILENRVVRDAYGGEEPHWVTVRHLWANIKPGSGTEFLNAQQVQAENPTTITIRYNPRINVMHRVRYLDKFYEIIGIGDSYTDHRWTVITAKELVGDELQRKTEESESFDRGSGQDREDAQVDGGCCIECSIEGR